MAGIDSLQIQNNALVEALQPQNAASADGPEGRSAVSSARQQPSGAQALEGQNRINARILSDGNASATPAPAKYSTAAKVICGIFTLGIGSLIMHFVEAKEQREWAKTMSRDIYSLTRLLDDLPEGAQTTIRMGGEDVTISCADRLSPLKVTVGEETVESPFTASQLKERLENDIVENGKFYGGGLQHLVLMNSWDGTIDLTDKTSRVRELSEKLISGSMGVPAREFSGISSHWILSMALSVAAGQVGSAEDLLTQMAVVQNADRVNAEEALELLSRFEALGTQGSDRVSLAASVHAQEPGESSSVARQEQQVRDFAADLVYNRETWLMDQTAEKPGARLRQTIDRHAETLAMLVAHPTLLNAIPEQMRATVGEQVSAVAQMLSQVAPLADEEQLAQGVRSAAETLPDEVFADMQSAIDEKIAEQMRGLQDVINEQFSRMVGSSQTEAPQASEAAQSSDPKSLDDYLKSGGADINSDGYGKFMQIVLQHYFAQMPLVDQKSMLASLVRYSKPDASPAEMLGACLKGAGPIMQKMLQGFNVETIPESFRAALADMKSNLAPIPDEIIQAHFLNMVERSNGQIQSIRLDRSLGAASVGQALLCTMTLASGEEKEVVVKILRPDAKLRADREAAIFTEASKQVNGMEVTFAGQLKRIMEELDLTVEARNIELGKVYNSQGSRPPVSSMSVNPLVEPTPSTLVLDKAPGTTIDKFLAENEAKLQAVLDAAKNSSAPNSTEERIQNFERLAALYNEVAESQRLLSQFTSRWVTEGIFGGGFYHGDLHAGNLMVGEHRLTVIDFGNATQLTPSQQTEITRMVAAAAVGDASGFMKGFRGLLSKEGLAALKAVDKDAEKMVGEVFALGKPADAGKCIAVVLTELQKMGLEVPAPIFNFSQCQMRLQATLDGMVGQLQRIKQGMLDVCSPSNRAAPISFDYLRNIFLTARAGETSFMQSVYKKLDQLDNENDRAVFEQDFATVFKAGPSQNGELGAWELGGPSIEPFRDTYNEYAELVRAADAETDPVAKAEIEGKAEEVFRGALEKCRREQLDGLSHLQAGCEVAFADRPNDFFSCMSDVITTNVRASLKRLGWLTAWQYGNALRA